MVGQGEISPKKINTFHFQLPRVLIEATQQTQVIFDGSYMTCKGRIFHENQKALYIKYAFTIYKSIYDKKTYIYIHIWYPSIKMNGIPSLLKSTNCLFSLWQLMWVRRPQRVVRSRSSSGLPSKSPGTSLVYHGTNKYSIWRNFKRKHPPPLQTRPSWNN